MYELPPGLVCGRCWGLGPWNGRLFSFPTALSRPANRAGEVRGEALMSGDLRGRANGAQVRIRVETLGDDSRRLLFKVAETEWRLAKNANGSPVELPVASLPVS